MLKKISKESKALILLEFTRALLKNSSSGSVAELQNIINEEEIEQGRKIHYPVDKKEIQKTVKEIIKEKEQEIRHEQQREIKRESEEIKPEKNEMLKKGREELDLKIINPPIPRIIKPLVLRIPEPRLPATLQYIQPAPHPIEIDLGKLNPLLHDPVVRKIECNGPRERIVVMVPIPRETNIILNKEEIDEIVKIFEQKSRIPVTGGIYNVAVGKYLFFAIISDAIGSKFTINKMDYAPIFR